MSSIGTRPKVLLFDIGGVLVHSPIGAILRYEHSHSIPAGWVNFAISRSGPHGAWQQIERGEIPMDHRFFAHFKRDLESPTLWRAFYEQQAKRCGQQVDEEVVRRGVNINAEEMYWMMMGEARTIDECMGRAVKRLREEHGETFLIAALSNTSIFPAGHPFSMPGSRRMAGAEDAADDEVRSMFDVFVSSAHVGMRKPEKEVYELAVRWCSDAWRDRAHEQRRRGNTDVSEEINPRDFVFLDDIGANLKPAKELGMHTIKVELGRTKDAVQELERATGCRLLDRKPTDKSKL